MNYLAHGIRFLDDPYFLAGTAVPDWLVAAKREIRLPPLVVQRWTDHPNPCTASLARGVMQHHTDDAKFHVRPAFLNLCGRFSREIGSLPVSPNEHLAALAAHVIVELLLDSAIAEHDPTQMEGYFDSLRRIDSEDVAQRISEMAGQTSVTLPKFIQFFQTEQFLRDYADDEKLHWRMRQIFRRTSLGELPEGFGELIPDMRTAVREHREELLGE